MAGKIYIGDVDITTNYGYTSSLNGDLKTFEGRIPGANLITIPDNDTDTTYYDVNNITGVDSTPRIYTANGGHWIQDPNSLIRPVLRYKLVAGSTTSSYPKENTSTYAGNQRAIVMLQGGGGSGAGGSRWVTFHFEQGGSGGGGGATILAEIENINNWTIIAGTGASGVTSVWDTVNAGNNGNQSRIYYTSNSSIYLTAGGGYGGNAGKGKANAGTNIGGQGGGPILTTAFTAWYGYIIDSYNGAWGQHNYETDLPVSTNNTLNTLAFSYNPITLFAPTNASIYYSFVNFYRYYYGGTSTNPSGIRSADDRTNGSYTVTGTKQCAGGGGSSLFSNGANSIQYNATETDASYGAGGGGATSENTSANLRDSGDGGDGVVCVFY